jgi:hypothetical protein
MLGISLGLGNWALICPFKVTPFYIFLVSIHKKRIYSRHKMAVKIQYLRWPSATLPEHYQYPNICIILDTLLTLVELFL